VCQLHLNPIIQKCHFQNDKLVCCHTVQGDKASKATDIFVVGREWLIAAVRFREFASTTFVADARQAKHLTLCPQQKMNKRKHCVILITF